MPRVLTRARVSDILSASKADESSLYTKKLQEEVRILQQKIHEKK